MSAAASASSQPAVRAMTLGIGAFVVSLIGIFTPWYVSLLGLVAGVLAVFLGMMELKRVKAPGKARTMAGAGIVLGGIAILSFVVSMVLFLIQ
jgi:hypothetical protein